MVHPEVVIFTSIKQVEVVPAILPANKVVFATHHKHHLNLQLSFKSTIATWNKEVTFSANKLVLRRVEVIETFCSTLLFFHKLKQSLVDMGVARMNSTKLKGISKSRVFLDLLPSIEYSSCPVNNKEEEGVGFWKFTEPRTVTCS